MTDERSGSESAPPTTKKVYGTLGKALYYLVSFIEGYDQQMLYMCMRAFELTLGFSQSQLSTMATILLLRFLHGFGLACIYPVQQHIVSNSDKPEDFNLIFGIMQGLNCLGRLLSAVITTLIARKVLLGYYGWRTSYFVLGYIWILFGISILFGMTRKRDSNSKSVEFRTHISQALSQPFKRATTWILILTIFIAEAPICAFSYINIYLQYLGVSETMAGVAIAVTLIGGAVISVAGGLIISNRAEKYDCSGEVGFGLVMMVVRLVESLLLFLGPQPSGKLLWYHYMELATLGGTLVTVGGVDRALLTKAIEDKYQGTASAMVRTISGIASSVVLFQISAYLSDKVFAYVPFRKSFETMDADIKERSAEALRKSMMYIILTGTLLNVFCYIALCCTYMGDRNIVDGNNKGEKRKNLPSSAPVPQ
ncbi:hypothetical protein BBBOND_0210270 [Babesia bigemina]|uniref:Major facilitator superfamily (MFS) profile domain-containing protein n=1 Tax=Babesia bigemina TaxID=5866 RepID=A0A061DAG0_BABBI|nr:hypothetical protein BBBOND_0210270 [Babesia bigemina]CDR95874.1 hypothetical protein BBBOND_0210270 [Babesia bigemina]|eukprot:XP_012768060.1 hypothetical protein BBBOND_0210270 [Babesia bigemina]